MRAKPFTMRPAIPDDAAHIAAHLRESDALELGVSSEAPEDLLRRCIRMSEVCDVGLLEGAPAFVIGCAQVEGGTIGVPWLIGTTALDRLPGALTRTTRAYIREVFLPRWPMLKNYVYAGSKKSVAWLARLGFTVHPAQPLAVHGGAMFHLFTMGAPNV